MNLLEVMVGDLVKDVRSSDDHKPLKVVSVTAKRFRCEIGWNEFLRCPMYQDYRKLDGRSVGNRHHTTFVRRCSAAQRPVEGQ